MRQINFEYLMYGFAAENAGTSKNPVHQLNVCFPDIFPDKQKTGRQATKVNTGSKKSALINVNPPQISTYVEVRNYMNLPCMQGMVVKKGQRLLVAFIDSDPERGHVLGAG